MKLTMRSKFSIFRSSSSTVIIVIFSLLLQSNGLLSATKSSSTTCKEIFPKECFCGRIMYEDQMQYMVNCTNAGLENTNILEEMPIETEILIFTGNNITELPWNVFGAINNYNNLKIVDMSNNNIQEIRGKSYHHVSNVKRLILNHNNLTISSRDGGDHHHHPRVFSNFINLESLHLTNAFSDYSSPKLSEDLHDIFVNSNLTKLQKLHLEQNEISHFKDRKVFCDLPNLRDLHLGDNLLTEINFDVKCLAHLRFLDFTRNHFEYMREMDLVLLDELEHQSNRININLIVDLELNPFVCDCRIYPLHRWMQKTNVTVRNKEKLVCFKNKNKSSAEHIMLAQYSKCIGNVPPSDQDQSNTATLVFLLVVLSITLVGLLAALVYVSRDKMKIWLSPMVTTISKKVHYSTIKDEDCCEVMV